MLQCALDPPPRDTMLLWEEDPNDELSRIRRSTLFYLGLVAVLGIVFWFTWQSMENGSKGDAWDYSTLLTRPTRAR
jgi:hypothetical protein